jgi:hypothetical protein
MYARTVTVAQSYADVVSRCAFRVIALRPEDSNVYTSIAAIHACSAFIDAQQHSTAALHQKTLAPTERSAAICCMQSSTECRFVQFNTQ